MVQYLLFYNTIAIFCDKRARICNIFVVFIFEDEIVLTFKGVVKFWCEIVKFCAKIARNLERM